MGAHASYCPSLMGQRCTCELAWGTRSTDRKPNLSIPEPAPRKNTYPAVWDLVIADMQERDQSGHAKYRTRLQPYNGRDPLVDAYQEMLDAVVYLRQAIYERDNS